MPGERPAGAADWRGESVRLGVEPMRSASGVLRRPRPGVRVPHPHPASPLPSPGPHPRSGPGLVAPFPSSAPRPGIRAAIACRGTRVLPHRHVPRGIRVEAADHPMQIVLVRQDGGRNLVVCLAGICRHRTTPGAAAFLDAFISITLDVDGSAAAKDRGHELSQRISCARARSRERLPWGRVFARAPPVAPGERAARPGSLPPGEAEGLVRPAARPEAARPRHGGGSTLTPTTCATAE